MKSRVLILIALAIFSNHALAQDTTTNDPPILPGQVTFLFPMLSTQGRYVDDCSFRFSLNPFIGYTGGVDGMELGGFMNINRYYMHGVQLSGFMNITGTEAGKGISSSQGLQGAGFMNVVGDDFSGLEMAGFANIVRGNTSGIQAAGFMNVTTGTRSATQVAGFGNFSPTGDVKMQVSGFINTADTVKGAQVAGFINVARGTVTGTQVSGFINVCDSLEGVQIGVINIVRKNGYRRAVVYTNEYSPLSIGFRMGSTELYNVYSLSKLRGRADRWAFGVGMGARLPVSERFLFDVELSAHQELWTFGSFFFPLEIDRLNMVNTLKFGMNVELHEHLTLSAGPTLNVGVAGDMGGEQEYSEAIIPYWVDGSQTTDVWGHNTHVAWWLGYQVAIVF